jgi:hypothetical protein
LEVAMATYGSGPELSGALDASAEAVRAAREQGVWDVLKQPGKYGLKVVDPTRRSRGRPEALRVALKVLEFHYAYGTRDSVTAKAIRRVKRALAELPEDA